MDVQGATGIALGWPVVPSSTSAHLQDQQLAVDQFQQKLLPAFVKVPVCTDGTILMSKKEDVFIPDDLLLKDLFDKLPNRSLFIWYPSSSLPSMSRAKLNNIHGSIGVQAISKAVGKNDSLTLENVSPTKAARCKVINVGMIKLVLAFLADPALDISAEERHKIVSCLLDVMVLETSEPITVGYNVKLSSGDVLDVKGTRKLRWGRESSKLYMQKSKRAPGYKEKLEFATKFADEISQGLLFEKAEHIPLLAEVVKICSFMDFYGTAVEHILKSKNLQLFPEDEEFLNTASLGRSRNPAVTFSGVALAHADTWSEVQVLKKHSFSGAILTLQIANSFSKQKQNLHSLKFSGITISTFHASDACHFEAHMPIVVYSLRKLI
ncbi:hypothetical protein VPH35_040101 [Triticum aestivum]